MSSGSDTPSKRFVLTDRDVIGAERLAALQPAQLIASHSEMFGEASANEALHGLGQGLHDGGFYAPARPQAMSLGLHTSGAAIAEYVRPRGDERRHDRKPRRSGSTMAEFSVS